MITVVVCTYNRDRMFEDTIRSFLDCRTGGIEHEVLLLDNNSNDKTREIGETYSANYPHIRYINEPVQGHPFTKNRGIREARGDIIAFVDDDVFFSPQWLEALSSSFMRRADIACVGGKVKAHFEADRPAWLEDDLLDVYSITRYGEQEKEIRYPEFPIGCNMAFRRSVFEQVGGFHTSLGRKPGNLLSNDEIYFWLSVEKANLKTLYSPDAEVSHRISPERTTLRWLMKRWYWQGISDIAMTQIGDAPLSRWKMTKKAIKTFIGIPRHWRVAADVLGGMREKSGSVPIRTQIDFCYEMGKLRQMASEFILFPGEKRGNG